MIQKNNTAYRPAWPFWMREMPKKQIYTTSSEKTVAHPFSQAPTVLLQKLGENWGRKSGEGNWATDKTEFIVLRKQFKCYVERIFSLDNGEEKAYQSIYVH
jgi:hypothetical protein